MTAFSEFSKFILPFVHDCSGVAAEVAARFACIEFCRRSEWLQMELDPIDILAGTADYELETPLDTLPLRIVSATIDGQSPPLEFKTQDELATIYGDWRVQEGTPRYITHIALPDARLVPSPDVDVSQGLRVIVAIAPTQDAQEVDDQLYERWAEAIAYGARARLKEMAGQPYYDPANAPAAWGMFHSGVSQAKADRQRDFSRAVRTVRMRRWT